MARILVVDDEPAQRTILQRSLRSAGFEADVAASGAEALAVVESRPVDLVLTDMRMPGMTGRDLLRRLRELDPALPIIVMTAYAELRDAVELVTHEKARYYIEKPIEDVNLLLSEIRRALTTPEKEAEPSERVSLPVMTDVIFEGVVGTSPPMRQLLREMHKLLPILGGPATVLVTGESGTGKELVARALHRSGPRRNAPFVPVHCAAIPQELMEAELFGAEKGAYTSSVGTRVGYFEEAHGGTLFLDEIAEIPPLTQVKLLRVLASREYYRVGSTRPKSLDSCLIVATNRELEKEVSEGRFRHDLYYRVNVFRLHVPPLRERREDIPELARFLLHRFVKQFGLPPKRFENEVFATLRRFPWPGNVRQLDHYIQQAVVMSDTDVIHVYDLPAETDEPSDEPLYLTEILEHGMSLEEVERHLILMGLERASGNQTLAAKLLGISRRKLQYRMEKHKISSRVPRDGASTTRDDSDE
jgi:DNA-binding NtrC family response regulator